MLNFTKYLLSGRATVLCSINYKRIRNSIFLHLSKLLTIFSFLNFFRLSRWLQYCIRFLVNLHIFPYICYPFEYGLTKTIIIFFSFFWWYWDLHSGFDACKVLYPLSHASSPFCSDYFGDGDNGSCKLFSLDVLLW
jgi:hypothetical protein